MGDMGVKGRMIWKVWEKDRTRVVCKEHMWGTLGSSLLWSHAPFLKYEQPLLAFFKFLGRAAFSEGLLAALV